MDRAYEFYLKSAPDSPAEFRKIIVAPSLAQAVQAVADNFSTMTVDTVRDIGEVSVTVLEPPSAV